VVEICGTPEKCHVDRAIDSLRAVGHVLDLSVAIVHANFKDLSAGHVSEHHARSLRAAIEWHGSDSEQDGPPAATFHPRSFVPSAPSGFMHIGRRTLPIETAEESNGRHGGRYLHSAQLHAPGVGSSEVQYHVVLRNDTVVLENRPEILAVECPEHSDELIVTSALPLVAQPG